MANAFKPRSWKLRADAAKHRAARERNMADIRAVRAALYHGEPVPADALARTQGNLAIEDVSVSEPETDDAPVVTDPAEAAEAPEPEPRKPGRQPKKPA